MSENKLGVGFSELAASKERRFNFAEKRRSIPAPNERAIAVDLWQWARLLPTAVAERQKIESHLAMLLEFYLCGLFKLIPFTSDRGLWCDGIVNLSLERTNRCSFLLSGAAFCPQAISPFEYELHFAARMDTKAIREVLRFGVFDHVGELRVFQGLNQYQKHWPESLDDWALHVELTPEK